MPISAHCLFLALIGGCGSEDEQPAPPSPVQAPASPVVHAWVQASTLRLRAEPEPDATFTTLTINTQLEVLSKQGDWLQVLTPDEQRGWVHGDFVGAARVTIEGLKEAAEAATTDAERLSIWQRAAAISPSDVAILRSLAEAYRASGDASTAEQIEQSISASPGRFGEWFSDPVVREADAVTASLSEAQTAAALISLWKRAVSVTDEMTGPLEALFDSGGGSGEGHFVDPATEQTLQKRLPWAHVSIVAEGTMATLLLSSRFWSEAAAETPETWDDVFFALQRDAYGVACGRSWATWQHLDSGYEGFSSFGNGDNLHLSLLKKVSALQGHASIQEPVGRIREALLNDILQPSGPQGFDYFPATPTAGLRAEANAILAEVTMSEEERTKLKARVAQNFGR
ncbi:MAG: SH3 domain-containing protein [Myxococcota bacterium]|nr:SH3 domain-containing protein [Myxococcota bacterium]